MMLRRSLADLHTKVVPRLRLLRCLSSTTHVNKVDSNIQIHQHDPDQNNRPLVLLLGWLFAKPSHLNKYSNFYMNQGFDVLTVQVRLGQVLIPKRAQKVMQNVLDVMSTVDYRSQPLLVHGFSVGAYLFGEMLTRIIDKPSEYSHVASRMYGQILDSAVDYYGIPKGFSKAIAENTNLRWGIQSLLEFYMNTFTSITQHYLRASDVFRENSLALPARFLYSHSDPVCEAAETEKLAEKWRQKGIQADTRAWDNAHHVSMFLKYPDEYSKAVIQFISLSGILNHSEMTTKLPGRIPVV